MFSPTIDGRSRRSLTSQYSDETLTSARPPDASSHERQRHGVAGQSGDNGPDDSGISRTRNRASSADPLNLFLGDSAGDRQTSHFASDSRLRLNSDEVARVLMDTIPATAFPATAFPATTDATLTPKTLSIHRPKLVKPNFFIRDPLTSATLYYAEMTRTNYPLGFVLHHGHDKTGSVAARMTVGRGLESRLQSRDQQEQNTGPHLSPDLGGTVSVDSNSIQMQMKFNCKSIQWKKGWVDQPLKLIEKETKKTLAVYTKAKKKSDGREGYLQIEDKALAATAEAMTVLTLCTLLEEKRLRKKRRSAEWRMGGAVTGIILGSVVVLGPILGPIVSVPIILVGNFHRVEKYAHG